jgi:hypothetical protein
MDRMELPEDVRRENFVVTIGTPRPESQDPQAETSRINLFLYRTTENGYLKNQEILGQGDSVAYGHPPLSLDLHYLITPYGMTSEGDFADERRAHFLLGSAMRVLHDVPVITDELTKSRLAPGERDNPPPVLDRSLWNQFEKVKLSLEPISLDDLSKIWTALSLPYRLSAAYAVSVVQIESERLRSYPRPVGEPEAAGPKVFAASFRSPQVTDVRVRRPPRDGQPSVESQFAYARIGDTLLIRGRSVAAGTTRVMLGSVNATPVTVLRDDTIEVTIPDDPALQPGPQPVKVVLDVRMGNPPRAYPGFQSNLAVFMLVPGPINLTPNLNAAPRRLRITGNRLYNDNLESLTLIGDEVIRSSSYRAPTPTSIEFNLPAGLGPGDYLVRVRVNGAESIDERTLTIR